ncbi:hypothetical protein GE061_014076 [Apolygus lucorum]|uniref:C-type lectin domain-containing protein n=1 Tax=Apolygus lucorum TaxID=248454 RepID=A0A8S9XPT7_APOLU|nr:hypothetical protein GE061_014076 [Apolygus lucorum]
MEKSTKKMDRTVLALIKKKKKLSHCNEKFSKLMVDVKEIVKKQNSTTGPGKCATEEFSSRINETTSEIVSQLHAEKDSIVHQFTQLVHEVKDRIYPDMMSSNVGTSLSEYDCKIVRRNYHKNSERITRIIEKRNWDINLYKNVMDRHPVADCKLKRTYFVYYALITWEEALLNCAKRHMILAMVKSPEEHEALNKVIEGVHQLWLGGLQYKGKWNWLDEPFNYAIWSSSLEFDTGGNKCIIALGVERKLASVPCGNKLCFWHSSRSIKIQYFCIVDDTQPIMRTSISVILLAEMALLPFHVESNKKIKPKSRKATEEIGTFSNWTDTFGEYDEDLKTEIAIHDCMGDLKTAQVRNGLLESQRTGKQNRIESLRKDTEFLSACNENYELLEPLIKGLKTGKKVGKNCDVKNLSSQFNIMKSTINDRLETDKADVRKQYDHLVNKLDKDSKADQRPESHICTKKMELKDHIVNLMQANGIPTERYQELIRKQLSSGCRKPKRYFLIHKDVTYYEALLECEKLQMRLVSIENEKENEDFVAELRDSTAIYSFIGGIEVDGNWTWTTGPMKYFNFKEPNFVLKDACLNVDAYNGKWRKVPCDSRAPFTCQAYADF